MLRRLSMLSVFAVLAICSNSAMAEASEAYVTRTSYLRAGPDTEFPEIMRVYRDEVVDVYGCTPTYSWCDIEYDGERGWFRGDLLAFNVDGYGMPVDYVAPFISLMILDFFVDDYWDRYYRDRPWYHHRKPRWVHWHLPPPPPNAPHPGAPPPKPEGGLNPKPGFKPIPLPGKPPRAPEGLSPDIMQQLKPKPGVKPVQPEEPDSNVQVKPKPGLKPLPGQQQPETPQRIKPVAPRDPSLGNQQRHQLPGNQPQNTPQQPSRKKYCPPGQVCEQ